MSVLRVHGGTPLAGEITVRGAKNFVSKAMVAAVLGDSPSELRNVPQIRDVRVVSEILRLHGVSVDWDRQAGVVSMDPRNVETAHMADIDAHAGSSRIPILLCGPLVQAEAGPLVEPAGVGEHVVGPQRHPAVAAAPGELHTGVDQRPADPQAPGVRLHQQPQPGEGCAVLAGAVVDTEDGAHRLVVRLGDPHRLPLGVVLLGELPDDTG